MDEQAVRELMASAQTPEEWNAKAETVRQAHGGEYPDYWFTTVMLYGGIYQRASATWPKELAR